jgi:hypothetical protein
MSNVVIKSKVLLVKIQNVFGVQKIYPANDVAELFAKIAGTKTLSGANITYAAQLGYSIQQVEAYSLSEATA